MRPAAAQRHYSISASNPLSDDTDVAPILSAEEYLPEVEPMPGLHGNPVKCTIHHVLLLTLYMYVG